ncbi:MAG: tyrosine-type recombinase/integrase [Phycisphaerales bacterium]
MKAYISASLLKTITPKERPFEIVDDGITGFLVRVQPTGGISFYFSYRTPEGQRKRYNIGRYPATTAPTAREKAELLAAQVTLGEDPQQAQKSARIQRKREEHETLEGFIALKYRDWALAHQRRGEETLVLLKRSFAHLYPRKLKDITAWDIQKWRSERKNAGIKPATINRAVTTLKAVLNRAVEWDVIPVNPLQNIKPLKLDNQGVIRNLSTDEEQRLRKALDDREADIIAARKSGNAWREVRGYTQLPALDATFADYLKPMTLLKLNTGLRRGEIFNLVWADINLESKTLTVQGEGAKSRQTRYIHLNSVCITLLQAWRQQSESELVFPSPITGNRFNNIAKAWKALMLRAEIKDFRFHDLRHSFASNLVMKGQDLYTVKELMGHSTIQMTERYAHLAPEHKAIAVESLVTNNNGT